MWNFNDAKPQQDFGSVIPDGTFVKLRGTYRRGGYTIPNTDPADALLFKQANGTSDAVMLDWEFVVLHGPYAGRKVWQLMTVDGGKRDDNGASKAGNITKTTIRAMINSAAGFDPKDMTDATQAKRCLPALAYLDGIEFAARLGVEFGADNPQGGKYPDKNKVAHIVEPGEPQYQAIMAGQDVPAQPSGASASPRPAAQAAPGWGQQAAGGVPAAWGQPQGQPAAAPVQQPMTVQQTAHPGFVAAPATVQPTAQQPAAASGPAWLRQ